MQLIICEPFEHLMGWFSRETDLGTSVDTCSIQETITIVFSRYIFNELAAKQIAVNIYKSSISLIKRNGKAELSDRVRSQ